MAKRTKPVKSFLVYDGEHSYDLEFHDRIIHAQTSKVCDGLVTPPDKDSPRGRLLFRADQAPFDLANTMWHETIHMAEIAEEDLSFTEDEVVLLGRYLARLFRNTPAYGEMLLAACKRDE